MIVAALGLLAAAATPGAQPSSARDPDLRCVAGVAAVLGIMTERKEPDVQTIAGLTTVFMYFLGKVDARHPGMDYAATLGQMMNDPGYERELPGDLKRCGAEAEARGEMLRQLGEELKGTVPLSKSRAG